MSSSKVIGIIRKQLDRTSWMFFPTPKQKCPTNDGTWISWQGSRSFSPWCEHSDCHIYYIYIHWRHINDIMLGRLQAETSQLTQAYSSVK